MMPSASPYSPPLMLSCKLPTEFLDHIIYKCATTTSTLVVCSTRDAFLQQLLFSVDTASPTSQDPVEGSAEDRDLHPYLVPSLGLILVAKDIRVVYCETLQHLRAYLSSYHKGPAAEGVPLSPERDQKPSVLALLNPLALHRRSSEFSAQGMNRTLANAVEAASREGQRLLIAECELTDGEADSSEPPIQLAALVPILNGAFRSLGGRNSGWSERTVSIQDVVSRLCVIEGPA